MARTETGARSIGIRSLALPYGVIGISAACLMAWRVATHSGLSGDAYWHLAAGNWMLDHHRVLRSDVFSYTARGEPWHTPEWGYDVVLAESLRALGSWMWWVLSAGMASMAVLLVAARNRLLGAGWTWNGLVTLEAGVAMTVVLEGRPQMVSYVLFAGLLLVITAVRTRPRLLWAAVPLLALWANVHGSFLLGLAVLALHAGVTVAESRHRRAGSTAAVRRALLVPTVAAVAVAANPFGFGVYGSALGVTTDATVRQLIVEWQPPDFHNTVVLGALAVPVLVGAGVVAWRRRADDVADLVLSALLLVATLQAVRFLPYFAIAWCAVAAARSPLAGEKLRPSLLVWPLVALVAVVFLVGSVRAAGSPDPSIPVGALSYLRLHPGRVFSTYTWNDYLLQHGEPVFVDGRTELYTANGVLDRYVAVAQLRTDPDPLLDRDGVRYVLWPTTGALAVFLAHDPQWRAVWRGDGARLFARVAVAARPA